MGLFTRITRRTDTMADAALGLGLGAVLAGETLWLVGKDRPWLFAALVGGTTGVLVLLRRRGTIPVAALGLVVCALAAVVAAGAGLPSQPGFTATAGLLVLGVACVRSARARPAALVAAAGVVVLVASRFTTPAPLQLPLAMLGVLLWSGAMGIGVWLRALDTRKVAAIEAARRDERLQLARELHDVAAHHLTGIILQAQGAGVASTTRPDLLVRSIAGIESAATEALAAMRTVVGLLREPSDSGGGRNPTPESLHSVVERFEGHGAAVQLRLAGHETRWSSPVRTTVNRIVGEALANVLRHAPDAHHVIVAVTQEASAVTVDVTDDGRSTTTRALPGHKEHGYGLVGMEERVAALGGSLTAGPAGDQGWRVAASIPLEHGSGP
jgi:signal transduction histidine kinase